VRHYVNATGLATLQSHYATDRMLEFDFVYTATNETYQVQYASSPRLQTMEGDDGWVVENCLVGTGRLPFATLSLRSLVTLTVAGRPARRGTAALSSTTNVVSVGGHLRTVTAATSGATSVTVNYRGAHRNVVTVSSASSVTAQGNKTNVNVPVTVSVSESVTATGTNP
jgi:hypothetical protein